MRAQAWFLRETGREQGGALFLSHSPRLLDVGFSGVFVGGGRTNADTLDRRQAWTGHRCGGRGCLERGTPRSTRATLFPGIHIHTIFRPNP